MEKIKVFISKYKVFTVFFLIVIFGLGGPILINWTYKYGVFHTYFITLWDVHDILSYYGTLLGATATIIAVTWTIKYSREDAKRDRRHAERIDHRNIGFQVSFDFFESCNPIILNNIIADIANERYNVEDGVEKAMEDIKLDLATICDKITLSNAKFQILYPKNKNEISFFDTYVEEYFDLISLIKNSIAIHDDKIIISSIVFEETQKCLEVKFPLFLTKIRNKIYTHKFEYLD